MAHSIKLRFQSLDQTTKDLVRQGGNLPILDLTLKVIYSIYIVVLLLTNLIFFNLLGNETLGESFTAFRKEMDIL